MEVVISLTIEEAQELINSLYEADASEKLQDEIDYAIQRAIAKEKEKEK